MVYQLNVTGICVVDEDPSDWPLEDLLNETLSVEISVQEMVCKGSYDHGQSLPEVAVTPDISVPQAGKALGRIGGSQLKGRPWRKRKGTTETEFLYFSTRYIRIAQDQGVGTISRRDGKPVLWITAEEIRNLRQEVIRREGKRWQK